MARTCGIVLLLGVLTYGMQRHGAAARDVPPAMRVERREQRVAQSSRSGSPSMGYATETIDRIVARIGD